MGAAISRMSIVAAESFRVAPLESGRGLAGLDFSDAKMRFGAFQEKSLKEFPAASGSPV